MLPTYLFYDIETTGLNKCFDQVLQFAAIRTDMSLNELERYNIFIKLNPDTAPSPQAILTHHISLTKLKQIGVCEYEAIKIIHQLFNTPFTTSIGYNTLGFDDEFLRFSFYRNLFPPYLHQYANGCSRMDLYPITVIYALFHRDILTWPIIDNKLSLRLEHLSSHNRLAGPNAHDAMTDVEATLALAQILHREEKTWQYLRGYFNKATDRERIEKYNAGLIYHNNRDKICYAQALLIDGCLGAKNQYQTVALNLGTSKHYTNQTLWLDLSSPQLSATTIDPSTIGINSFVFRKKLGEPPLLLPNLSRLAYHLNPEKQQMIAKNLAWLQNNQPLFQAIADYYQNYKYPEITNLDIDAALYTLPFPSDHEQQLCQKFHNANLAGKIALITQITNTNLRIQALRLLGRNYFTQIPEEMQREFLNYLQQTNPENSDLIMKDYCGKKRFTINNALDEIIMIKQQNNLTSKSHELLDELDGYLKSL